MAGHYSVVNIFTGAPVVIYGRAMFWLAAETADELADVLNQRDLLRRGSESQIQ
jgi:hypothetical protein